MSRDDSPQERQRQFECRSEFTRGYACAVATLQRMDGSKALTTEVKELMSAGGLNFEICTMYEVDSYDMEVLFPKGLK